MKKMIFMLLVISLMFSVTPVHASTEDSPSNWAAGEVNRGVELGIVPERLQSRYQSPITREEFAELIVNTVFVKVKSARTHNDGVTHGIYWTPEMVLDRVTLEVEFEDAKQDHVKLAYILGSINGVSDNRFAPDRFITRQEAAVMLVNTSHISMLSFPPNSTLNYSDFDQIADWAKPAVQAAWAIGYMQGVGDRFDYAGHITREQAIATVIRLYERSYTFALRGNLPVYAQDHELKYIIGKKHIIVNYEDDGEHTALDISMIRDWNNEPVLRDRGIEFIDMETAIALLAFTPVMRPRTHTDLFPPTLAGENSKWDYDYMTVSIFDEDGLLKFEYKDTPGNMTLNNGYRSGYPLKPVVPVRID